MMMSLLFSNGKAQSDREIATNLLKLRDFSIKYDTYIKSMPTKHPEAMKEVEKNYRNQIDIIKNGPNRNLFIKFLDKATGADSLKYKDMPAMNYIYMSTVEMQKLSALPNLLEYYKVVKYSLFTLNKEELVRPEKVPFLKYKEKLRKRPMAPFK
jgi:hypothetical protein